MTALWLFIAAFWPGIALFAAVILGKAIAGADRAEDRADVDEPAYVPTEWVA